MWVEKDQNQRIKRRMWSALRNQLSYTSGTYIDKIFGHTDNQNKVYLPINSITDKLWYTDEDSKNMRVIVSALVANPTVWKITKCVTISPVGLQELTLYTNFFNKDTDYVNLETGEMYADYYDLDVEPSQPTIPTPTPTPAPTPITSKINASTPYIKVGGSYKILTVNLFNDSHEDITSKYSDATFEWTCDIDGEDWTDIVAWRDGTDFNQKKIKFTNDKSQLKKILNINCKITQNDEVIEPETLRLEITN